MDKANKRMRVAAAILGMAAFGTVISASALYWYPNDDDHAARVLCKAGVKVRRTSRLLWLASHSDTEIFPYGDVWDLELNNVAIDRTLADNIASLRSLDVLHFWNCRFEDNSTNIVPPENKLRILSITKSNAADRNIVSLAHSQDLVYLILKNTEISDESIPIILSCKRLNYIVLEDNKFSKEGIQRISAGFPNANVVTEKRPTVAQ